MRFRAVGKNEFKFTDSLNYIISELDREQYGIKSYMCSHIWYDTDGITPIIAIFEDLTDKSIHAFDAVTMHRITRPEGYLELVRNTDIECGQAIAFFKDKKNNIFDLYCKGKLIAEDGIDYWIIKDRQGISFLIVKMTDLTYRIYDMDNENYVLQNIEIPVVAVDSNYKRIIVKDDTQKVFLILDMSGKKLYKIYDVQEIQFTDIPDYYLGTAKNGKFVVFAEDSMVANNCNKIFHITKNQIATRNSHNNVHLLDIQEHYVGAGIKQYFSITDRYQLPKEIVNVWINEDNFLEGLFTISTPNRNNPFRTRKITFKDYFYVKSTFLKFDIQNADKYLYDEIEVLPTGQLCFINVKGEGELVDIQCSIPVNMTKIKLVHSFNNKSMVRIISNGVSVMENGIGEIQHINEEIIPESFRYFDKNFMTEEIEGMEDLYLYTDENNFVHLYNIQSGTSMLIAQQKGIQYNYIYPVFHNLIYNSETGLYLKVDTESSFKAQDGTIAFNDFIILSGSDDCMAKVIYKNGHVDEFDGNEYYIFHVDDINKSVLIGNYKEVFLYTNEGVEHFEYDTIIEGCTNVYKSTFPDTKGLVIGSIYVTFNELKMDIDSMLVPSKYRNLLPTYMN